MVDTCVRCGLYGQIYHRMMSAVNNNSTTLYGLENRYRYISFAFFAASVWMPVICFFTRKDADIIIIPLMIALILIMDNVLYAMREGMGTGTIGVSVVAMFFTGLAFCNGSGITFPVVVAVVCGAAAFALLIFFTVLAVNAIFPHADGKKMDAAIVLGTRTNNGKPGKTMRARLKKTEKLLKKNSSITVVLSGGNTGNDTVSEAEVMRGYLTGKVPDDKLIVDADSRNTMENLINSMRLLKDVSRNGNVCLVTSDYHMFRARMIAKKLGYDVFPYPAPVPVSAFLQEWSREAIILLHDRKKIKNLEDQNADN